LKVGFFDSGIGGLTVLAQANSLMRGATLYYYGDNSNAPYGERSGEEIFSLVRPAFDMFLSLGVNAAVIACNTATAACVNKLREKYPYLIIGMEPAVSLALKKYKTATVLCTPHTAGSEKFLRLISGRQNRVRVFCPPFLAADIEKNALSTENINLSLHIPPLFSAGADCVVLGCTHYVLIKDKIEKHLSLPSVDGNLGTALHLINSLTKLGVKSGGKGENEIIFLGAFKNHNKMIFNKMKML